MSSPPQAKKPVGRPKKIIPPDPELVAAKERVAVLEPENETLKLKLISLESEKQALSKQCAEAEIAKAAAMNRLIGVRSTIPMMMTFGRFFNSHPSSSSKKLNAVMTSNPLSELLAQDSKNGSTA